MFKRTSKRRKAQATVEYIVLVTLLMVALIVFGKYIKQSFAGRWRTTGDTFGQGMQFDAYNTIQCRFDTYSNTRLYFDIKCYENSGCDCHSSQATIQSCYDCVMSCQRCNDNCPQPYVPCFP